MDSTRIPVIVGIGQAIERDQIVDAVQLAGRAAGVALDEAPGMRERISRLSMVKVSFSAVGNAPASQIAERLGMTDVHCEVSNAGGNMPQWLVSRAAGDIAQGRLDATLIVGAEATRSMRAADPDADFMRTATRSTDDGPGDETVGPPVTGMVNQVEIAARLFVPAEVYPLLERTRSRPRDHAAKAWNCEGLCLCPNGR